MNLLTVDLQKEMLKKNRLSKQQQLIITEANSIIAENQEEQFDLLKSVGLAHNLKEFTSISKEKDRLDKFDQQKIFSKDQIKSICVQYGLRFLPTECYKGTVDATTHNKVREFKEKHGDATSSSWVQSSRHHGENYTYFIAAPKASFQLQEHPKDPLLFACLGNDKYYLIHKWGNDLSRMRWITNLPKRNQVTSITVITLVALIIALPLAYMIISTALYDDGTWGSGNALGMIVLSALFTCIVGWLYTLSPLYSEKGNDESWNSIFKD